MRFSLNNCSVQDAGSVCSCTSATLGPPCYSSHQSERATRRNRIIQILFVQRCAASTFLLTQHGLQKDRDVELWKITRATWKNSISLLTFFPPKFWEIKKPPETSKKKSEFWEKSRTAGCVSLFFFSILFWPREWSSGSDEARKLKPTLDQESSGRLLTLKHATLYFSKGQHNLDFSCFNK